MLVKRCGCFVGAPVGEHTLQFRHTAQYARRWHQLPGDPCEWQEVAQHHFEWDASSVHYAGSAVVPLIGKLQVVQCDRHTFRSRSCVRPQRKRVAPQVMAVALADACPMPEKGANFYKRCLARKHILSAERLKRS